MQVLSVAKVNKVKDHPATVVTYNVIANNADFIRFDIYQEMPNVSSQAAWRMDSVSLKATASASPTFTSVQWTPDTTTLDITGNNLCSGSTSCELRLGGKLCSETCHTITQESFTCNLNGLPPFPTFTLACGLTAAAVCSTPGTATFAYPPCARYPTRNASFSPISYNVVRSDSATVPTTGGSLMFTIVNSRLLNPNAIAGFVAGTQVPVTYVTTDTLKVSLPAFTNGGVLNRTGTSLKVYIEGTHIGQLTYDYTAAVVTPKSFTKVPSAGDWVTYTGSNLGIGAAGLGVVLAASAGALAGANCTNISMSVPHKQIKCHLSSGHGNYTALISLSGSTFTVGTVSYREPDVAVYDYDRPSVITGGTFKFKFEPSSAVPALYNVPTYLHLHYLCEIATTECSYAGNYAFACPAISPEQPSCVIGRGGAHTVQLKFNDTNVGPQMNVYYKNPIVSAISPMAIAATGGTLTFSVSEAGLYSSFTKSMLQITVGGSSNCPILDFQGTPEITKITCNASSANGLQSAMLFVSGRAAETPPDLYISFSGSVSSITLKALFPTNPNTRGSAVAYLNATVVDATTFFVNVDGTNITASFAAAAGRIMFVLPPGFGGGHKLYAIAQSSLGSAVSNTLAFSYSVPVFSVINDADPIAQTITISGDNFGQQSQIVVTTTADNMALRSGRSTATTCNITVAHTEIVCPVPRGVSAGHWLTVTFTPLDGTYSSCTLNTTYAYEEPVILNVSSSPTQGNSAAIITGKNIPLLTPMPSVVVLFDGATCSNATIIADNCVRFNLPAAVVSRTNYHLIVLMVATKSSSPYSFYYSKPDITQVSRASTEGGPVNIFGSSFGPNGTEACVRIGDYKCSNPVVTDHAKITCQMPAGYGYDLMVYVNSPCTYGDVTADATTFKWFNFYPPVISQITTDIATSGGLITVKGANFGPKKDAISVTMQGFTVAVLAFEEHTSVAFYSITGVGTGKTVQVSVNSQTSNAAQTNYLPPSIEKVTTASTSGGSITITGQNFGPASAGTPIVKLGSSTCTGVTFLVDHFLLQCLAPAGAGRQIVTVTVGGQQSNSWPFYYNTPSISSATMTSTAGGLINITGENFGASAGDIVVYVHDIECTSVVLLTPHTKISCIAPPGTGVKQEVRVYVSGQYTTNNVFSYEAPNIFNSTSGSTLGGDITISGQNFGQAGDTSIQVNVDNKACSSAVVVKDYTSVRCSSPAGTGASKLVEVVVGGQRYITFAFSYYAPVCHNITNVDFSGGLAVISGANFGSDTSKVIVKIGDVYCNNPTFAVADTVLTCTVPAGESSKSQLVTVTVDGQSTSNATTCYFSYIDATPPVCNLTKDASGNTTNSDSVTVNVVCNEDIYNITESDFLLGGDCSMDLVKSLSNYQVLVHRGTSGMAAACSLTLQAGSVVDKHNTPNLNSSNTVNLVFTTKPDEGKKSKVGMIAGIVVGVCVALGLCLGATLLLLGVLWVRRRRQHRAEEQAQLMDIFATASTDKLEDFNTTKVALDHFPLQISIDCFTFSEHACLLPINKQLKQKFTVTNTGEDTYTLQIFGPKKETYRLAFDPDLIILDPGAEVEVTAHIIILATTNINGVVTFIACQGEEIDSDEELPAAELPLEVESEPSTFLDPFEIDKVEPKIAEGAFGVVYRGRYRGQEVAVKILKNQEYITDQVRDDFKREVEMMEMLRSPYVCNIPLWVSLRHRLYTLWAPCTFRATSQSARSSCRSEIFHTP
eukprot:TRINITY_DN2467_c2_g1_i10.p1 TRINITY_DN2467_c2_g1~~TRINITY_DN2467_c2_g1_i10.p1  ORF type:complete len:1995 (+),score=390.57 TRINITY_DN2467_c2_g1_i10:793-5985(+)